MLTRRRLLRYASVAVPAGLAGCVSAVQGEIDPNAIESLTHDRVNRERRERGVSELTHMTELARDARSHSRDMAERDYFGHVGPDGRGPGDRVSVGCPVGENIAQTWVGERIETTDGETRYNETAEDVAADLVRMWLTSPEHRENLLASRYTAEGIGVHVTENGMVFATQLLCAGDGGRHPRSGWTAGAGPPP